MNNFNWKNPVLALIVTNFIWGGAPPIFKWALEDVHPMTLAFLRFFIAGLIFLPFVYKKLKIRKEDILSIFLIGFSGITINIIFFFYGLKYAPSINAAIIASSGPIFIIFASFFFLKEKIKTKVLLGSHIGLLGVLLLVLMPLIKKGGDFAVLGNFFFVIATLGVIVQTIFARKIMPKYNASTIAFWSFFIGSITFLPFFLNEVNNYGFLVNLDVKGIAGILFGAFFSSLIGYYLYYWSLKYMNASDVSIFVYIDPLVTILIAIPLLGEIPNLTFILGALFVFGGIFIAEQRIQYHPLKKLLKQ